MSEEPSMNMNLLQKAVEEIQADIKYAVEEAAFLNYRGERQQYNSKGEKFSNGLQAKEALIRSGKLIQKIHEAVKNSIVEELLKRKIKYTSVHPPLNSISPEIDVWGLLKKKKQDIVFLFDEPKPEIICEGALIGDTDLLGRATTDNSIVIGVRSQLSSIDKNFDTLMERAFAETLNLRLRHSRLVMGEVYMLPVREYDEQQMKNNSIGFKSKINIEKFISIFNSMSGRTDCKNQEDIYKYEKSTLILVDFSAQKPKIYLTLEELKADNLVSADFNGDFNILSPQNFANGIVEKYITRHFLRM